MAALLLGLRVHPPILLWKDPLPPPVGRRVGILPVQGSRHLNTSPAFGQVTLMDRLDLLEVLLKWRLERVGKHGNPVFRALAVADENLVARELNILNPQAH